MKKIYLFFFVAVLSFASCTSNSDNVSEQIDYATLDSLQTEVVLEIGESDDFLPGQLRSVVVTSDGGMLVSDWASVSIEQFDADGNHRATVATKGKGPGEMQQYFRLVDTGNDTLLVNQMITQKDYFVPDEDGIYRFLQSEKEDKMPDRSFSIMGMQSDTSYYAMPISIYSSAREAENENQNYKQQIMAVTNSSGKLLQDSVQTLKSANSYVKREGNSIMVRGIPFRFDDETAFRNDGSYLIARTDSNAIFWYEPSHELKRKIPLKVKQRTITGDDLEHELGEIEDTEMRNGIEARIGEYKPPFLNIYSTNQHIWLHTDTGEEGKEIVVLDYEGNAIGKFMLPEVDSIQEIKENRIYTIHRSPTKGDLIRVYEVQL